MFKLSVVNSLHRGCSIRKQQNKEVGWLLLAGFCEVQPGKRLGLKGTSQNQREERVTLIEEVCSVLSRCPLQEFAQCSGTQELGSHQLRANLRGPTCLPIPHLVHPPHRCVACGQSVPGERRLPASGNLAGQGAWPGWPGRGQEAWPGAWLAQLPGSSQALPSTRTAEQEGPASQVRVHTWLLGCSKSLCDRLGKFKVFSDRKKAGVSTT